MLKRTTIEIDDQLLRRAKRALGLPTTRATIEESLKRAAESVEGEGKERAERQVRYLETMSEHLDLDVLRSDEMWR